MQVPVRRQVTAAAGDTDKRSVPDSSNEDELQKRILSGEFTDSGSTKEKLTRPVRKILAQDPVGVGEWLPHAVSSSLFTCSIHCAVRKPVSLI